jgi:DNA-binding YbaB/EbfC family protein
VFPGIGLGNLMEILKHAGKFQKEAEELKSLVVEGSAGGGMVRVRMNGKLELMECKIEPQVLSDHDGEMLEDLIVAATNQALAKLKQAWMDKFGSVFGGMNLPGFSQMLGAPADTPKSS